MQMRDPPMLNQLLIGPSEVVQMTGDPRAIHLPRAGTGVLVKDGSSLTPAEVVKLALTAPRLLPILIGRF